MPHHTELILTVTFGLAAAWAAGWAAQRLRLSPIVGYLLAGLVVGPYTPGFVANGELAEQLAEIGVILLMFAVGLHFHMEELLAVRHIAIPGAIGQSLVATALGMIVALAFGWSWQAGIVYGLALSVASTVVLTRVLSDHAELHTPTGHIAIGWLVVEDLFTVIVLVLLPVLFGPPGGPGLLLAIGLAVLKISILLALTFPVGGRVIPWLLARVAQTGSRELFTLTVLVVALGIAVSSALLFGVSMALGAFLAGMVVGRSEFSLRAATDALPMRDAFAVLFFVSVGMQFEPAKLFQAPGLICATMVVVVLGKPLAALAIVLWMRYPLKVALSVAVALAQIGEFSFILATMGLALKVLPEEAASPLVATAILSIAINQILYQRIEPVLGWVRRRPRLWSLLHRRLPTTAPHPTSNTNPEEPGLRSEPRFRAIVVGYGPVGRTLVRLLLDNQISPTVIEMNLNYIRLLRATASPRFMATRPIRTRSNKQEPRSRAI